MSTELTFSCACGQVHGGVNEAGPAQGDHVVCHCTDCQNFARYLGAAARVLGPYGGTALYQSRCAKMRLIKGAEQLACLHLTNKPTLRWYTTCCRTPLFNTYRNGRVPYVTSFVANFDPKEVAILGPPIGHLFLPDTLGDVPGMPRMSFGKLMRRFAQRMVFDAATLEPVIRPQQLTEEERRSLA